MTALFASHAFTVLHVAISLLGILSGIVAIIGIIRDRPLGAANTVFLVTTIATTLTGFLFPLHGFDPAIGVGIVSTCVLGVALAALYAGRLGGIARPAYAISATAALYLNMFVGVVQAFQKIPALQGGDPAHPPLFFLIVQAIVFAGCVTAGILATRNFHPQGRQPLASLPR